MTDSKFFVGKIKESHDNRAANDIHNYFHIS